MIDNFHYAIAVPLFCTVMKSYGEGGGCLRKGKGQNIAKISLANDG